VCGGHPTELAHTVGRSRQDVDAIGPNGGRSLWVNPDAVVPLCKNHHMDYDGRRLDLLPYLSVDEQINAVDAAGGIELARNRLTGGGAC
jgi:hypothetical protein